MRRSGALGAMALATVLGALSLVAVGTAEGGMSATGSSSNQAGSGAAALADTVGSTTCSAHGPQGAAGSSSVAAPCTSSLAPTSVTTSTSPVAASVSNPGTLGAQLDVASSTCGLQQAADSSGSADTAIAYGGVTFGQPGPLGGSAVTLDGSTGYLSTVTSLSAPTTGFTELAWFKTTGSGSMVSFENVYGTAGPGEWDRMLWVDPAGHVVAGVYPGSTQEAVSSGTYSNGAWHLAEMTVSSAGLSLYVDGALQATDPSGSSAQAYTGYWHIGWSNATSGWPDPPTNAFFPGSLSGVAVLPTALSAAQSQSLFASSSFSTYTAAVDADGPSQFWSLQDSGTTPYLGTVPGSSTTYPDVAGGDTATPVGGATPTSAGPLGGGGVSLNGTTGYLTTADALASINTFTQLAWFQTTGSGSILTFQNAQGVGPGEYDRILWVDPTGHVVAGVYPGSTQELVSPGTYANGQWHLAEVTLSPAGFFLYVDGTLVASNASVTSGQAYTGYWQMGWSKATQGWPDPPSSGYFPGSLSGVAILPTALSAAQSQALYASGSFSAYTAAVSADGPSQFWPLQSQNVGGGCGLVDVTVQIASICVLPSATAACPAPSGAATLASLSAAPTGTAALAATASAPLTLTYALGSAPPSPLVGAHVVTTLEVQGTAGAWSAALSHPVDIQL